jgi:hypothetical protein
MVRELKASTSKIMDKYEETSPTSSQHERSARQEGLRFSGKTPTEFQAEVTQDIKALEASLSHKADSTQSTDKIAEIHQRRIKSQYYEASDMLRTSSMVHARDNSDVLASGQERRETQTKHEIIETEKKNEERFYNEEHFYELEKEYNFAKEELQKLREVARTKTDRDEIDSRIEYTTLSVQSTRDALREDKIGNNLSDTLKDFEMEYRSTLSLLGELKAKEVQQNIYKALSYNPSVLSKSRIENYSTLINKLYDISSVPEYKTIVSTLNLNAD